jgi:hypothetical protein
MRTEMRIVAPHSNEAERPTKLGSVTSPTCFGLKNRSFGDPGLPCMQTMIPDFQSGDKCRGGFCGGTKVTRLVRWADWGNKNICAGRFLSNTQVDSSIRRYRACLKTSGFQRQRREM